MNTLHTLFVGAMPLLSTSAALAQNGNMMDGAWGDGLDGRLRRGLDADPCSSPWVRAKLERVRTALLEQSGGQHA